MSTIKTKVDILKNDTVSLVKNLHKLQIEYEYLKSTCNQLEYENSQLKGSQDEIQMLTTKNLALLEKLKMTTNKYS